MSLNPSVSLNNKQNCREIREDKMSVCKKTAGLRSGKFSDLNSACSKMSVRVKIFQFQDMLSESERYCDATNGLNTTLSITVFKHCLYYIKSVLEEPCAVNINLPLPTVLH